MRKINKNIFTFSVLTVFLGIIVIKTSQKFFPLLSHSLYYCQTFIQSLSIRIPHQFVYILPTIIGIFAITVLIKFFFIYIQVQQIRKGMILKSQLNKRFSNLLQKLDINDQTYLVESQKAFAFCFGIRNPKIYISTATVSLMTEKELEAILVHEKYHMDNKDNFTMLLASISNSLFPYFPIISDLLRNFRIERELGADHEAVKQLGDSKILISVLKKFLSNPSVSIATAAAIIDSDTIESRIKALVKHDYSYRKFSLVNILLSMITAVILSGLILVPVHAVESHAESQDVMMVCLQGDECVSWCKEHNTVKPYPKKPNASYPYTPVNL